METIEERTDYNQAELDYPDEGQVVDTPEDYGYQQQEDQTPVPVRIVEELPADRTLREWSPQTILVPTGRTVQVGSRDDLRRTRLVVKNTDVTNYVTLTRGETDAAFVGYQLLANEREVFYHKGAVWARANTADCVVTVYSEYEVDDDAD
jgi:ATP-dependent helicase YprA (DUF1998 family)